MNKKEIKAKVNALLALGTAKTDVFVKLAGQGVKDSQLAHFIASYADQQRCSEHSRKVSVLVTIMIFQALIAFLFSFGAGMKFGPNAKWIIGFISASIPILFAFGFYKNIAGAYNAYIILTIIQLPNSFTELSSNPIATTVVLVINLAVFGYVWYVRKKIFPDFAFIGPKKIKGQYVFSS